jgi:hypothetical protein
LLEIFFMTRFLLTTCLCAFSTSFLWAQKYPVAQALIPLLNELPPVTVTSATAKKIAACKKDTCCAYAAVKNNIQKIDSIETRRHMPPKPAAEQLQQKVQPVNDFQLLVQTLPETPREKAGMLGNKTINVLSGKPFLLHENNKLALAHNKTAPAVLPKDSLEALLQKLCSSELVFRKHLKQEWLKLQEEYNTTLENLNNEKKDREAELNKTSLRQGNINRSDAENLEQEFEKKYADHYVAFMKNKAQVLLTKQKQDITVRYAALENLLKRLDYGTNSGNNNQYLNMVDGQTLILDMVQALTLYTADCIVSGCELAQ